MLPGHSTPGDHARLTPQRLATVYSLLLPAMATRLSASGLRSQANKSDLGEDDFTR